MIGLSVAWVEQLGPWLLMLPIAAVVLAVVGLCCRADPDDTWPTHDPREADR